MTLQLALDQIQRPTWWFEEADRVAYKNQWTQSDSGKIKKETVLAHIRQPAVPTAARSAGLPATHARSRFAT
jgi:hypothetical protein